MISELTLYPIERLELIFEPKPWQFAIDRRAEIDAVFAGMVRENPALWNGRVLLLHRFVVEGGVLRGAFLETDFASFSAWRHWGWPDAGVHDCFGVAAVQSVDGAFLLGRMAPHTFSGGLIYFPAGTPDAADIFDGRVDFEFSVRRELKEETGLDSKDFTAEPGWTLMTDGGRVILIKVFQSSESGEALRERVYALLAKEKQPEFSEILVVRGPGDFDPAMLRFVQVFLTRRFAEKAAAGGKS